MPSSELKNRDYISWSAYNLYKKSPEEYKRIYIDEGEQYVSLEMEFGKNFAEGMENGSDDIEIEAARILLPNYPKAEYEIVEVYKGVKLKGRLDLFNPRKKIIGEIKTGKTKWSQIMADKHGQLKFYNLLCLAKYGVMAKEINLYWFETEDCGNGVKLNGNHKVFKIKHSISDLLIFFNDLKRVNEKIIKLRKKYGY